MVLVVVVAKATMVVVVVEMERVMVRVVEMVTSDGVDGGGHGGDRDSGGAGRKW